MVISESSISFPFSSNVFGVSSSNASLSVLSPNKLFSPSSEELIDSLNSFLSAFLPANHQPINPGVSDAVVAATTICFRERFLVSKFSLMQSSMFSIKIV